MASYWFNFGRNCVKNGEKSQVFRVGNSTRYWTIPCATVARVQSREFNMYSVLGTVILRGIAAVVVKAEPPRSCHGICTGCEQYPRAPLNQWICIM